MSSSGFGVGGGFWYRQALQVPCNSGPRPIARLHPKAASVAVIRQTGVPLLPLHATVIFSPSPTRPSGNLRHTRTPVPVPPPPEYLRQIVAPSGPTRRTGSHCHTRVTPDASGTAFLHSLWVMFIQSCPRFGRVQVNVSSGENLADVGGAGDVKGDAEYARH